MVGGWEYLSQRTKLSPNFKFVFLLIVGGLGGSRNTCQKRSKLSQILKFDFFGSEMSSRWGRGGVEVGSRVGSRWNLRNLNGSDSSPP